MNIVYMGTGEIGLPALQSLIDDPAHAIAGVFTQPDKPVGRRQIVTSPAVKRLAIEQGIPVFQPPKIGAPEPLKALAGLEPEVIVVVAYGQILPRHVFEAPSLACINLHASLLPKFRGAAPIQAAIREGETESGITVIYIDEGLDSGDIMLEERIPIQPGETGQSLHDRLASLAPAVLAKALDALARGAAPRIPQIHSRATKSPRLVRKDGHIDWNQPAALLERTIRAYHPWPGTFTTARQPCGGDKLTNLKIFPGAAIVPWPGAAPEAPPGTVLSAGKTGITVSTGMDSLRIDDLQPEGRKRMSAAAFLRGSTIRPGDRFS